MRSARPKRIVSAAKRSERIERKIEVLNRSNDANAASADAAPIRIDVDAVLFVSPDGESDGCENGEA